MIGLDIETMPNENMIDCLPEPEAPEMPGTYKKAETIDKWNAELPDKIAALKKKMVTDMALSPYYGRICSIAVHGGRDGYYNVIREASDCEEADLIKWGMEYLIPKNFIEPSVITWNGFAFDVPYIFKRAMMLKIDMRMISTNLKDLTRKYTHIPHCDMAMELSSWDKKIMSLDNAAKVILGERKIDCDFRQFSEMIKAGKGDEIGVYNLRDAELTIRLYQAAKDYIF